MPTFCLTILYYIMRIFRSGRVTNLPQHTPKLEHCFIIFSTLKPPNSPKTFEAPSEVSNMTFTPKTCGAPETYYCCCCNFGPMSLALHPACISCGHWGCSTCNGEAIERTTNSAAAPTAPEPTPPMMTDTIPISDNPTTHSQAASSAAFGRGDLSETKITSTTHRPFCNETPINSRDTVWYCCDCGLGPNWITLDIACVYCRHSRCSSCTVDPQK